MFICETEFERPDPKNPDYSMTEVDYYGHIPYGKNFPSHRLTLRKCLYSRKYEVIRVYGKDERTEVVFSDESLAKAVEFANNETEIFWRKGRKDQVCEHRPPNLNPYCRIWKDRKDFADVRFTHIGE